MTVPTFADVFRELNSLKDKEIIREYAIGGATAVAFLCGAYAYVRS
jgi:hypothetical protein